MRKPATASAVFIGIALVATAVAVLGPAADRSFSPIPPEVFERAKAMLPSELHSFEARESFAGRTTEIERETAVRPSPSSPGEPAPVSDHNEADNDLPFEESLGSEDASGGGTEVRRVLRVGSDCDSRPLSTVELALEWLKKTQREDGAWDGDVQTTGLVLLGLLGAGETHRHGRYKKVVREALEWLTSRQAADGWFTSRDDPGGQAIATLALCEAFFWTPSPLFKESSRLALDALRTQGPSQGPATWWMLFAQQSAKQGGLQESIAGFERALGLASPNAWSTVPGGSAQAALGAGILARIFAGEDPRQSGEIEYLVSECLRTPASFDELSADPGALYLNTVALFRVGGDAWKEWSGPLRVAVQTSQVTPGGRIGYWESESPRGRILGRTRTTALMLLTLEVYYRYAKVFGCG